MCDRCVEFEGNRYHWDGETPYLRCRGKLLHREMWKSAHGPIPAGHHVHHKDGDSWHNELANFVLRTPTEHAAEHSEMGSYSTPARVAHLESIRPLAAEWHASAEGRQWHSEHGRETWKGRQPRPSTCEQCGAAFETMKPGGARFCSNACKTRSRALSGVDDEDRVCAECGETFRCNRYTKKRFCGRSCAARDRRRRQVAAP